VPKTAISKTEGEYELVLGNRQLLSAFFIIVILLKQYLSVIKRPKMHDKSLSESRGAQPPWARDMIAAKSPEM